MKKSIFNNLFIAVIISISTASTFYGCNGGLKGSGNIISQSRQVNDFTSLKIEDAYDVTLVQGDSSSVTVIADDNFLPLIKTEVSGDELKIYNDKPLLDFKSLKLLIRFKKLDEIITEGAVNLTGDSLLRFDNLKIKLGGAAKLTLHLQADELSVTSQGASKINLSGNCNKQYIKIEGAGTYNAYDLVSNETEADLMGAAEAYLNVAHKLTADCAGASVIKFKGEPSIKEFKSVGASSIEPAGK